MLNYQPAVIPPTYSYPPVLPLQKGPALSGPQLGQTNPVGALPALLGAAVGAGTAWVGWTVGSEKAGFQSVTGYVVGVLGAIGAVGGTIAFLSSLTK